MSYQRNNSVKSILKYAAGATTVTAGYTAIINKIPGVGHLTKALLAPVEVGGLTFMTDRMCRSIAKHYGYENLGGITSFIAIVVGAASGPLLAQKLTAEQIPLVGEFTNAVSTATLHVLSGAAIIGICELFEEGVIDESYVQGMTAKKVANILGSTMMIFGGAIRGCIANGQDLSTAVNNCVESLKVKFQNA